MHMPLYIPIFFVVAVDVVIILPRSMIPGINGNTGNLSAANSTLELMSLEKSSCLLGTVLNDLLTIN